MKQHIHFHYLIIIILLYISLGVGLIFFQSRWITEYQYAEMGRYALNMAELGANSLKITSDQVDELMELDFEQTLLNESNRYVQDLFRLTDKSDAIKYAYVLKKLDEDEIKYEVNKEDADFYENPIGSKLDYIWLLDVIVNENEQLTVKATKNYYIDKHRYTHPAEDIRQIDENRTGSYLLWHDEWGTQIAGLAPLYTTDGEYIGLFGVDFYSTAFYSYRQKVLLTITLLLAIPTLLLTALFLWLYIKYRRQMGRLAYQDPLTCLFNRRYYEITGARVLKDALRKKNSLTAIMADIDHFKIFNDQYGHQEGDRALKLTAAILTKCAEECNGLACRYGGEEFLLLVESFDAARICEEIRSQIASLVIFMENGVQVSITISLGACCLVPDEDTTLDGMVQAADHALYEAKHNGRNTFVVR